MATLDVDVFVALEALPGGVLVSPQPTYDYLLARGCAVQGEYLVIAGWPVQFLPPTGPLVDEALEQAVEHVVGDTSARVFTAEHLAAIALQTGCAKDRSRLLQFVEAGALEPRRFQAILGRHGLAESWQRFERRFLREST